MDSKSVLFDDLASHDLTILDPCAGGDGQNGMAYPTAIRAFKEWDVQRLDTMDIRADSRADVKCDYLTASTYGHDIIITNPPFPLAVNIIEKALRDVRARGLVCMLQRVNFWGSKERKEFFNAQMPALCYVHSKRVFPDSIEYAHFVWQQGNHPRFTKLRII